MENKDQKNTINTLYVMLVLSTILSFVPMMIAQSFSLILLIIVLIGAYYYRSRDNEDGLLYNHMTYMIGTIWIGTSFIVLGIIMAGLWIYQNGDHSIIDNTIAQIQSGTMIDEAALNTIMLDYMKANYPLLMKTSLVTIGPAILYFVYRVGNGFARSLKGYRIANPKSWL